MTKMNTISSFCWEELNAEWAREFGEDVRIVNVAEYIENEQGRTIKVVKLGISWSCEGTQDPMEAAEFAAKLQKAAMIAASHPVNGARIIYK